MWKTIPTKKIEAHFKITTFPYVMQAWVLECLQLAYSSLLATKIGNGYPRIIRWHTVADSKEATLTIYESEDLPYGYVIPEALEMQKDYHVSVINWVDKSSTYVFGEDEEANSPGFLTLTSAFQKLDRKVEEEFRCLDERMDKFEARVADMEMQIPDGRKMELNVDGLPVVYEFDGEKLVAKDLEHHTTMESLDVSMYKGDDVSDQPTIEEGGMPRLKCHYLSMLILRRSFHATP
ncbi:hypothetical protein LIER_36023 [Lithospermum erythrorhizon]|uniref:Uncharacterized protein n=1 Tax=Lithospermum erythrorhizon TaxID=34254 RepID=A0AAV3P4A8_LITER